MVPGAMFSIVMSAFFNSSLTISRPRGDLRLRVTDFLLALNWWKYQGSSSGCPRRNRLPGSPSPGFSILTTSAPSQASASVQDGPASNCVKSTTRTPARQSSSTPSNVAMFLLPKITPYTIVWSRLPRTFRLERGSSLAPRKREGAEGVLLVPAFDRLLDALWVDPDFDPGALLLQYHWRARVTVTPTTVQRLTELGQRHIGDAHRHIEIAAELGRERHVLMRQTQRKCRRLVFSRQKSLDQSVECAPPAAGTIADGFP